MPTLNDNFPLGKTTSQWRNPEGIFPTLMLAPLLSLQIYGS